MLRALERAGAADTRADGSVPIVPSLARIAGITITLLAALWLGARFLMWEPDGLEQGSLLYQLKIPARAKEWPLWHATDNARYDFRHADGEARGYTYVRYTTTLQLGALHSTAQAQGYECTEPRAGELVCDLKHGDVYVAQVTAEPDANDAHSKLTVSVFE